MKRCHTTHINPLFGEIPAGSVWDDDSPFTDDEHFADADAVPDTEGDDD